MPEDLKLHDRGAGSDGSDLTSGYDPIGGARFAGTAIRTLSATGHDLVGNSTTLDTGMDSIRDVLAQAASEKAHRSSRDNSRGSCDTKSKVDFVFRTAEREAADKAKTVLKSGGAKGIKVSPAK